MLKIKDAVETLNKHPIDKVLDLDKVKIL